MPPVRVFAPPKDNVPAPALVIEPLPLITPSMVSVPANTLAVRALEPNATSAPVPRLRSYGPANVTVLFQSKTLFVESVIAAPLVLPSVVPATPMKNFPVPIAVAELMLRRPALKVVSPV